MQLCYRWRQVSPSLACIRRVQPAPWRPSSYPSLRSPSRDLHRQSPLYLRREANVFLATTEEIEAQTAIGRRKGSYSRLIGGLYNKLPNFDVGEFQLRRFIKIWFDGHQLGEDFVEKEKLLQGLEQLGFGAADLDLWNKIILNENTTEAATILCESLHEPNKFCKPVPSAIVSRFLRNRNLPPEALQLTLHYISQASLVPSAQEQDHSQPGIARDRKIARFANWVRVLGLLLDCCRRTWPEAIPTVVTILIRLHEDVHQSNQSLPEVPTVPESNATILGRPFLTSLTNEWLQALAKPTSQNPLANVGLQKAAQFDLLRWMDKFNPPLTITRDGYRGIIATQLASPQSHTERDWTAMQAPTWPPWKVDRSGLDVAKDKEYGASGAFRALERARESGYGDEAFEQVAQILAGWDIDQTPTIQTRARLSRDLIMQQWDPNLLKHQQPLIWATRIRATRTVQEAWAAFLSWRSQRLPANIVMYFEMLDKIAAEDRRQHEEREGRRHGRDIKLATPGSKEVLKASDSPKEAVYISEEVPSFDELVTDMREHAIFPDRGFYFQFLIMNAASVQKACEYLQIAGKTQPAVLRLLDDPNNVPSSGTESGEHGMAGLTAFVKVLCKFPTDDVELRDGSKRSRKAIEHAIALLRKWHPSYPPPWHYVLDSLSKTVSTDSNKLDLSGPVRDLERFNTMQSLRRSMRVVGLPLDSKTFTALCQSLYNATVAARAIVSASREQQSQLTSRWSRLGEDEFSPISSAEKTLQNGYSYIRKLFYELVGTQDARVLQKQAANKDPLKAPKLLVLPHGKLLHPYARVLGVLGEWHGLLELSRWIFTHREAIEEATEHTANGSELTRRAIVAIRTFSEKGVPLDSQTWRREQAPRVTIEKMRDVLQHCTYLGGWPKDSEIRGYVDRSVDNIFE